MAAHPPAGSSRLACRANGLSAPALAQVISGALPAQCACPPRRRRTPVPAPDRARSRRRDPQAALGAGGVTSIIAGLFHSAIELALDLAQQLAPPWLLPIGTAKTHGSSRWARRSELSRLGRPASPQRMRGDGIVLGWHAGRLLQSPAEDNVLLLGVQRSGKTSTVVVPTLLGWDGAAVATSTKQELVELTAHVRVSIGPVAVFAPLDRDHAWIRELGLDPATWNPLDAVDSCGTAAELADHFTAPGKRGDSSHWYLAASSLLTGLAVCERERGGDMRTLLTRLNRTLPSEYIGLAKVVEDPNASDLLVAFALTPDREAGSIASTARSALSLWNDNRVAEATKTSANSLDLDLLLSKRR